VKIQVQSIIILHEYKLIFFFIIWTKLRHTCTYI